MDAAQQLRDDTIPFVPRAPSANAAPLQIAVNPFVASANNPRAGRALQTAFGEVVRQIGLQTAVVVVVGPSGTGKSLLLDMTARTCAEMGLSVRRIERGDQVHMAFGAKSDVLLVDQTDLISNSSLQTLLSADGKNTATTMVFMCLPSSARRFGFSDTTGVTIELTPLASADSRDYLQEKAMSVGRANLFTPEALDLVVYGSRGLPRLLRSIAHLAFFGAASEGASQIGARHVANACDSLGVDGHNADIGDSGTRQQVESTPRAVQQPAPERPAPPAAVENQKTNVHPTVQLGLANETDRPAPISQERIAVASDSRSAANRSKEPEGRPASTSPGPAAAAVSIRTPSISTAPHRSPPKNQATRAVPVKQFHREGRSAEAWSSRAVGIAGALIVPIVICAALAALWMSNNVIPRVANAPSAVARPVETIRDVAQAPAPTEETVPSEAELAAKTPVVTNTEIPPTPENPQSGPVAAPKQAQDKARAANEVANRIKPASDQTPSVVNAAEQATRANDAAAQAEALKAAEAKAAAEAAEAKVAAEKVAEAKAAAEKAAADRSEAAVQAFLLAQEAGRQAQAARDAKADKDANERAQSARQKDNRTFSNSLFGVR